MELLLLTLIMQAILSKTQFHNDYSYLNCIFGADSHLDSCMNCVQCMSILGLLLSACVFISVNLHHFSSEILSQFPMVINCISYMLSQCKFFFFLKIDNSIITISTKLFSSFTKQHFRLKKIKCLFLLNILHIALNFY